MSVHLQVDEDVLTTLCFEGKARLHVLLCLSEAEQRGDRDSVRDAESERLFWRGVEDLCRDVMRDIEGVQKAAGIQGPYVMLANKRGGER